MQWQVGFIKELQKLGNKWTQPAEAFILGLRNSATGSQLSKTIKKSKITKDDKAGKSIRRWWADHSEWAERFITDEAMKSQKTKFSIPYAVGRHLDKAVVGGVAANTLRPKKNNN